MCHVRRASLHSFLLLSSIAILPAQTIDTGILGTVTDATGAVVANAAVTITQPATGFARTVATNAEGFYEVRYLVPGEYTVEVRASGFRSEHRTGIVIQIGQQARINFAVQVGAVEERIDVTAEAPLMSTENAALGQVVSRERIVNLPLNGRRFLDLAALTPGVTVTTSAQYSILKTNGTRNTTMALNFDGVTATTNRWAFVAVFPTLDAIQEFKVQTGNATAEYGGNAGANVNVQFKSGANDFHGSAYEFLRNDKLDARAYFRPAPLAKDILRRNQFGAVVSGRIIKDKTFFMAGWESQRNIQDTAGTNIVLTPAQRQGDFSALSTRILDPLNGTQFPGNIIPASRLNPVSVNLTNTYLPLPNQSGSVNYAFVTKPTTNWNQFLTRIDHRFSDRDQFSGHYIIQNYARPIVGAIPVFKSESDYLNQNFAVQEVHTFSPTRLNELRFGYHRGYRTATNPRKGTDFKASDIGINGLLQGGPDGRELTKNEAGFPTISISGFLGMGESGGSDYDFTRTFQVVDNFSLFRGNHSLKMGVDIRKAMADANTINWPYGQIEFTNDISGNAAAAWMLGFPRDTLTPEGQPVSANRQWRDFFYFQDDWKVRPNLTLNLGIRYDLLTLPHDINGNTRTLRFDLPGGPVLWPPDSRKSAATNGTVADMWENEHWHFAPRFGFAYRYNDKTTVRGGYGIFTMTNQMDNLNVLQLNPPAAGSLTVINSAIPVATIQNPVPRNLYLQQAVFNVVSIGPERKHINAYFQNWNLQVSRQLSRNDALEVGYMGNKGTFLDTSQLNFNSPDPGPGDIQSRRPYQGFGRIRLLTTDGNSIYHSLQSRFEHRLAKGLSLTTAYNWAHMIDDQEDETNGSRCQCQDPRHRGKNERASSIQDIRHRLVIGYVWEFPFTSRLTGAPKVVLDGWQLGGIVTLQSGVPFRITQSADTQNNDSVGAARPDLVPGQTIRISNRDPSRWFNTAAFTASVFHYGNTPRNPVTGPGLHMFDLSVGKQFKMPYKEGHSLQFRTEMFNAFNTPQFSNPGASLGTGSFGRITGTSASNRQIQFGLRYAF
ncbi:MAG: TonB-dependent receptor [Acidobacteriales bacterium]|nr:TonB-dependent receptor [Terriglobales bacterium]